MGSLSGLFDLTRSSLAADQTALSVTADNVANQNTVGYTRQLVNWTAGDTVSLSGGKDLALGGPSVEVLSRRDRVLEQRVQQQVQVHAGTAGRAEILGQVEQVFSLTGGSASAGATQIGTALNSFFSSLSALAGSPADTATKQGVLSAADALANAFNAASNELKQIAAGVGAQLQSSVTRINSLTDVIAKLNGAIVENSPSSDARGLEDQRQAAIAQLSKLVGLDQVSTEGNGITLTTLGGTVLVAGDRWFSLSAVNTGGSMEIRDRTGTDVGSTLRDGSVGGQLLAQNTDLPTVGADLDAIAFRLGTAVNLQNAAGVTPSGVPGGALFAFGSVPTGAAGAMAVVAAGVGSLASSASGEGATGNTNASALSDLALSTGAIGQTIGEQFAGLLSQIGTMSSSLQEQTTTEGASLTQLTTQRDRLSGVSLDDEAASLSQYQRAYQAAAKVLSVLDQLMAAAINLGTQTTVG